ncbi:g5486 [Coccomyxa viridis]|uniref:G5486 protein n=1 Tax=Coccomyxa viridis TaxID=1274662 RepID=A0ABP1FUB7_9CHLO
MEVSAWSGAASAIPGGWSSALVLVAVAVATALLWRCDFFGDAWRFFVLFKVPHPPEESFLLGSAWTLIRKDHHRAFNKWGCRLGPIYAVRVLCWHLVVVVDAVLADAILGSQEGLSKAMEPDLSDALLSHGHRTMFSSDTNSPYWRLIRKGTAPAFISANIKNGFPDVIKILTKVIANMSKLQPGTELDMNNVTLRISLDVTGLVGFAKDFQTCDTFMDAGTDELFEIIKLTFRELYSRTSNPARKFWIYSLWSPERRRVERLFKQFRLRMSQLLQEVKARGEPAAEDVSIAAHLLRLRDPATGQPLPDNLLAGEFGMYFSAGLETSGNAISWTLYLISQHPEVDAKLAAELDEAGLLVTPQRPAPRAMDYADLARLTYLGWVCKEAMRVRPVAATGVTRYTKRAMKLGGCYLPAGTMIAVPFYAVHHNPNNWEDPDAFIPERWSEPGAELVSTMHGPSASPETQPSAHPEGEQKIKRFLAFSMGPRQCIGRALARIIHDASVAQLVSHFRFQLAERMGGPEGVDSHEINRLTMQPGQGMWMSFQSRAQPMEPIKPVQASEVQAFSLQAHAGLQSTG